MRLCAHRRQYLQRFPSHASLSLSGSSTVGPNTYTIIRGNTFHETGLYSWGSQTHHQSATDKFIEVSKSDQYVVIEDNVFYESGASYHDGNTTRQGAS